jgi:hypothetical protein
MQGYHEDVYKVLYICDIHTHTSHNIYQDIFYLEVVRLYLCQLSRWLGNTS